MSANTIDESAPEALAGAARAALAAATGALWRAQRKDGAWDFLGDAGVVMTAEVVVALAWTGRLRAELGRACADDVAAAQRPDGAWPAWPHAAAGGLGVTAKARAALQAVDPVRYRDAIARAEAWLAKNGGDAAIRDAFDEGDVAVVFSAMAGLAPARAIPAPPVLHLAVGPARAAVARRLNAYAISFACELHLVVRRLRGELSDGLDASARTALAQAEAFYEAFQNADGSVNQLTMQTVMLVATLHAAGRGDDPRVARALEWLERRASPTPHGATMGVFSSEVWSTAHALRALHRAGVRADDPRLSRAVRWLVDAQCREPHSPLLNRRAGALLQGGWAYQRANDRLPDCDDTAVTAMALGEVLRDPTLGPELRADVARALDDGLAWLRGMQNPDGGWAAFTWGLPSKRPGPGPTRPTRLPRTAAEAARFVRNVPPELGDPSTEGLTGRALVALGIAGEDATSPAVARAIAFFEHQQCDSGAFWGRWLVNYLPTTAYVLLGLAETGGDVEAPWAVRARRFLLAHQRDDGGWGEDARTYAEPERAGTADVTMPGLTGLVLTALLAIDSPAAPEVLRGVASLVRSQRADGTWDDRGWLAPALPPTLFYDYPSSALFYPVEALGRFVACVESRAVPPRVSSGRAIRDEWAARLEAGMPSREDLGARNAAIAATYAGWYVAHGDLCKWAGMAAVVSYGVGRYLAAMRGGPPSVFGVRRAAIEAFRGINNAIFDDIGWAHAAFLAPDGGLEPVERALSGSPAHAELLEGFRALEAARRGAPDARELVWTGAKLMLRHEQRYVAQPRFASMHPLFAAFLSAASTADFRLGDPAVEQPYVPALGPYLLRTGETLRPDVRKFEHRWAWLEGDVVPCFRAMDEAARPTFRAAMQRVAASHPG